MQYYKRGEGMRLGEILLIATGSNRVKHRHDRSIPGMKPAQDIWVFAEDPARDPTRLYMTIKNPCKPYRPIY